MVERTPRHGRDGLDGLDGLSAYELAVAKGFVGPVDAWLESLRGEPGKKGDRGDDGESGKNGLDADPQVVRQLVEEAVAAIPKPQDGKRGPRGERGFAGKDAERTPLPLTLPVFYDQETGLVAYLQGPDYRVMARRGANLVINAIEVVPMEAVT